MSRRPWHSRSGKSHELEEEIRSHLAMDVAERVARGESPADAELAARRQFGNVPLVKEVTRDMWGGAWLEHIQQDVRYAVRSLTRAPMFTAIVALILAIGIGVNGAVVSIIDTAFLRKLPVPDPERIVVVRTGDTRVPLTRDRGGSSSFPDANDLAPRLADLGEFGAYVMYELKLGDELAGNVAWSALVTGNYFELLGVRPQRGRLLGRDDEQPAGAHPVAVISDHLWRTTLGADDHVLGRQLTIADTRFTIVGVMPPGFTGTHPEGRTDVWIPYTMEAAATGGAPALGNRDARLATIVGRLGPGVTLPSVQGRLDAAARDLAARYVDVDQHVRFRVRRHDRLASTDEALSALTIFLLVWAMVGLLHLVACSNVAGLMLARAAARRREIGVRLCLGASRGRVIRLMLTESLLLAVAGSAGGIVVARWLTSLICSMRFLSAMDAGLDARLLCIIVLLTVATTLVFGLLPAREAARNDPVALIRGASHGRADGSRRTSTGLIVGQMALSLVLLAAAAAMLRGFDRQAHADPGYDTKHVVIASLALRLPPHAHADPVAPGREMAMAAAAVGDAALARVATLPGVERVAMAHGAPLYHGWYDDVTVQGHDYGPDESPRMSLQTVGPGYFAIVGAPILRGRDFTVSERGDPLHARGTFDAVIVNESMARRYWPGGNPLGKQVSFRGKGLATVVGVVRDMRDVSTLGPVPRAYFPALEWFSPRFEIVVRATDAEAMVPRLRAALSGLPSTDPPVVRTLDAVRGDATIIARVAGVTLAICAGIALLLTAMGLYGLVAMWADERRIEIGIRLALGARRRHVHQLLLGGVGRLLAIGAALGTVGASVALRLEASWIGPVMVLETAPLAAALGVLTVVAAVAAFLPSYAATRASVADVIRAE